MKLGSKILLILIFIFSLNNFGLAENIITSTPLINVDKIKPSFEETIDDNENLTIKRDLKEKKKSIKSQKTSHAILIGLDNIHA